MARGCLTGNLLGYLHHWDLVCGSSCCCFNIFYHRRCSSSPDSWYYTSF